MSNGCSLQGKRILITRAKEQAKSFSRQVEELGGIPIGIPLIKFQCPIDTEIIESTLRNLHSYDWIVFTSVNGVQFFFDFLDIFNIDYSSFNRPQIAVVGKKTLEPLQEKGISVDLIPEQFVAESLIEEIAKKVSPNSRILLARGNLGRSILPEKLTELGMIVDDLFVYETVADIEKKQQLVDLIQSQSLDMITFTSSSTVTYFIELLAGIPWRDYLKSVPIACIGPITEQTAVEVGIHPDIVALDYTIDGLVDSIVKFYIKETISNERS